MLSIVGSFDFLQVEKLWANKDELFINNSIDLSNVIKVDSAGIAFLVIWAKNLSGTKLHIKSMPLEAKHLVELFKVTELFDLD